jgi:H+/Cl- antiporter ClcA
VSAPEPPSEGPVRLIDRRWLGAVVLASAVAVPAALATIAFVGVVNVGTRLVWDDLFAWSGLPRPVFLLLIPTIGGAIVGCILRFVPGKGGPEPGAGHGLGGNDHEPAPYLPGVIGAAVLSLVAGASLGPEAPLVTIIGGIATHVAARLRLPDEARQLLTISGLSSFTAGVFGSPLAAGLLLAESVPMAGLELYRRIIPALAAATVGYFVFHALLGSTVDPMFPGATGLGLLSFATALAMGIVGGVAGVLYIEAYHRVRSASAVLDGRPVIKATLGGLVVGLVAIVFGELTLFSGEHTLPEVVGDAGALGAVGLALLLVGKLIASLVSLVSGFRGGRIFPILFLGGVLGLLVSAVLPDVSTPVAVATGMGAMGVAALRIPLFMVILAAVFTSVGLVPEILVAVVTSYALTVGRRSF